MSIKEWIAETAEKSGQSQGTYTRIYPAQSVELLPPHSIYPQPHPEFGSQLYEYPEAFVANLEDTYVIGPDGYVVSSDRRLMVESTWGLWFIAQQAYPLQRPYLKRLQHKQGVYATLAMPWSNSYYHWFLDALPRLALLEAVGEAERPLIISRFGGSVEGYRRESLELLGIPPAHRVYLDDEHWHIDRLIFPSYPGVSGEPPPWVVKWLRQKFLSDIQPARGGLRLYICRSGAQRRRVVNESEVVAYLQTLGFQSLQAERFSLHEQICLFANAKVIVAPHGAGLTNMLFARGAAIVEIINPAYFNLCYYRLANVLGHSYWYILGLPVVPDRPLRWEGEQDLIVPLDALSETIEKVLHEL